MPEEPGWDSPWGHGRPGWHLECSVMSERYLGATFDIHGGGLDLIFPHHENEIAQSCCAHDNDTMANYWLHNGFVQVEGKKMSKSLGNFITIHDLLDTETFGGRKWPGEVLRVAMLMTHYREPIDFSVKRLEEAERLVAKWPEIEGVSIAGVAPSESVLEALCDDLNTVSAIQQLHALAGEAAKNADLLPVFAATAAVMGVKPLAVASASDVDSAAIDARVAERLAQIEAKNWGEADRIRDELASEGILLKDSKDSATGKRVTTWELKR